MKFIITNSDRYKYDILVNGEEHKVIKIFYTQEFAKKMGISTSSGGWIENKENLSQEGDCYISEDTMVVGNARILENAKICNCEIADNTIISGNAVVEGSKISGDTVITDNAKVKNCVVFSATYIGDNAVVEDSILDKGFSIKGDNCFSNNKMIKKEDLDLKL